MSTIFNIRNLRLPHVSRAAVVIGTAVVIVGLVALAVGHEFYKKLTTTTVVAYFPEALALYSGDKVANHGHPRGFGRQDRARGRQDESDPPLRQ